ncbi:MAG: hypothetical protein J6Q40_02660 [Tidjanibacter sp.]|nr:hypothetical protein [Tidjanibacter sp.]
MKSRLSARWIAHPSVRLLRYILSASKVEDGLLLLTKAGFSSVTDQKDTLLLHGTLFNQKDTIISLFAIGDIIDEVLISIQTPSNWQIVRKEYLKMQRVLHRTTLLRIASQRQFAPPYKEGDGRELEAIKSGSCHYVSIYRYSKKVIGLSVGYMHNHPQILISITPI